MQSTDGILDCLDPEPVTVCRYESHTVGLSFLCHPYEILKNAVFFDHLILPSVHTLIGLVICLKISHYFTTHRW